MITPRMIAALFALLVIAGGAWGGYRAGVEHVQAEQGKAIAAMAAKLKQAEERHDVEQITIDRLRADVERVRIHLPACPGAGTQDADVRSRALSARMDEGFGRLQERAGELFARCDRLNIDARRAQP